MLQSVNYCEMLIDFKDGKTSHGYSIGVMHYNQFYGAVSTLEGVLNKDVTHIALHTTYGNGGTIVKIYPISEIQCIINN